MANYNYKSYVDEYVSIESFRPDAVYDEPYISDGEIKDFALDTLYEIINDKSTFNQEEREELNRCFGEIAKRTYAAAHRYRSALEHHIEIATFEPDLVSSPSYTGASVIDEAKDYAFDLIRGILLDERVLSKEEREKIKNDMISRGYKKENMENFFSNDGSKNISIFEK